MYEQLRNEFIERLVLSDPEIDVQKIVGVLDSVINGYKIERQTTDLAVVGRKDAIDLARLYFIIRQQQGMSMKTVQVESIIIHRFIMTISVPLNQITANNIRAYLYNYQQTNGVSNRTLELYRSVICAWFKWLHCEGYVEKDVTAIIKKINYQKKPRKALSQLQLQDVRYVCKNHLESALVQMFYSTGCRVSELVNIKLTDIDWIKKEAVVTGKGNKIRTVYINAKAEKACSTYIESRRYKSEWLFMARKGNVKMSKEVAERIIKDISVRLGLEKGELVPHTFRHTMATQAATVCPIQHVQTMLGHSSINTTMIYAQVNKDQVKNGHRLSVI